MKEASDVLIAFLASGKAMVMWDTFTFTLADGTVLTYSTRDQDAPALPTTPPPTYDELLDTFAGSGSFAEHVGEQSADWAAVNELTDLENFSVANGALFTSSAFYIGAPIVSQWVPEGNTSSFFMEANLSLSGGVGSLRLRSFRTDFATEASSELYIDNGNGGVGPRIFVNASLYGASSSYSPGSVELPLEPDGTPHVLRMEVSGGRNAIEIFVDGNLAMSGNLSVGDSIGAQDYTGFQPSAFAETSPIVYELSGGPLLGFVFDSFTGTGSLATHVGEAGATWSVPVGQTATLAGALLNGSGGVYLSNLYSDGVYLASGNAPVDEAFFVEIDINVTPDGYNGQWVSCGVCTEDLTRIAQAELFVFSFSPIIACSYFDGSSWHEEIYTPVPEFVPYSQNTIRMEMSADRTEMRAFVNGVHVATLDLSATPADAMPRPFIKFSSAGEGRPILRVQGDTL